MFGLGKKNKNSTAEEIKEANTTDNETYITNEATAVEVSDGSETATSDQSGGLNIDVAKELKESDSATTDGQQDQQAQQIPPLTWKEGRALRKSKYFEKIATNPKFDKVYVIRNKKTGQIVEINAASSFHACNIIGWKPNKVRVLEEKTIERPEEVVKAEERLVESSSPALTSEVTQELPPGLK